MFFDNFFTSNDVLKDFASINKKAVEAARELWGRKKYDWRKET